MEKLYKFLSEAKSAADIYKDKIDESINVVIGNVSCDMDSAVGAMVLSYYLTYKNEYFKDVGNYENFWIPIINCPREEICARIDLSYHLKHYGIDHTKLVYIDDLDLNHYSQNNLLKLAIIDHNMLDYSQKTWEDSVVFIVDHHVDLKAHPNTEKILQFCGSACSLAMNLIFEQKLDDEILTRQICEFFLAAILIDTENFKPSLKNTKWAQIDEDVFTKINRVLMRDYYFDLIGKKTDRALNVELGLNLILRKDYKNYTWKNCIAGISVIFNPFHEIMSTFGVDELRKELKSRIDEKNLNIHLIITQIYLKGEAFREVMIYDEDQERLKTITEMFEKKSAWPLHKKRFTGLSKNFAFYYIKDESVSRKKLEPIFKEIFEQL